MAEGLHGAVYLDIMENQMEKIEEHKLETGFTEVFIGIMYCRGLNNQNTVVLDSL